MRGRGERLKNPPPEVDKQASRVMIYFDIVSFHVWKDQNYRVETDARHYRSHRKKPEQKLGLAAALC